MSVWFQLKPTFTFSFHVSVFFFLFFFFFSAWPVNLLCRDKNYCSYTVSVLFTYCNSTVHALNILKMGLTVLFTPLKIILLQYFQFSVSATISSIQTVPQSHVYSPLRQMKTKTGKIKEWVPQTKKTNNNNNSWI